MINASQFNYKDLCEQYTHADREQKHAALCELGSWFRYYSEGRYWNGEYWDCPECGIRIRPVYAYNEDTDEYEDTDDYEEA